MSSRARPALALVGFLAVSFLPSVAGAFATPGAWYAQLDKPAWNPPAWLFGPVWTALYATIGVAGWLVWRRVGFAGASAAWVAFAAQLVLNALWSPLFFGLQRPGLALGGIVALWVAIVATVATFWRHDRVAGGLLLPYLGWVSFATALNFALWRMN